MYRLRTSSSTLALRALFSFAVAVMVTFPAFTPVTTPFSQTVATEGSEDEYEPFAAEAGRMRSSLSEKRTSEATVLPT